MGTDPSTEGLTSSVTLAPASYTVPAIHLHTGSGTVTSTPVTSASAQTPSEPDPKTEERVRHFQSVADQAKADAERARQEAEALKAQMAAHEESQKALHDSHTAIANEALKRIQEMQERLEREKAERLRAEALMRHPELKHYAKFLPATTDETQLAAAIAEMQAARTADLEAMRAQQPTTPYSYPRDSFVPTTRPDPTGGQPGQDLAGQIAQMLADARAKTEQTGDESHVITAMQEAIRLNDAAARRASS